VNAGVVVQQQQDGPGPVPQQGEPLARYLVMVADREGVPRRALLALAYAESNWNARARRPVSPSQDVAYWPDVSSGAFQQTVAFSDELKALGLTWQVYPGPQITARILDRYYDVDHSARVAAGKLRTLLARPDVAGNHLLALFRYNKPNGTPALAAQQNYQNGLAKADELLARL
jgi:hypothetical protein